MSKLHRCPAPLRAVVTTLFLALAGFWAAPRAGAADANPPERMTYQGFLADGNGIPLATNAPKNYDVVFRIWNDASLTSTNNRLWTEQQTVTVDKGYFSVLLGEGTVFSGEPRPILSTIFTNATASDRYVEMTVNGIGAPATPNVTMLPRLRLLTAPYSFLASKAMTVDGAGVTSGTVPDGRLSANVALRNAANNFTGDQFSTTVIGARSASASAGYIDMRTGDASNTGYLEFLKPGPTRIGYMGHSASAGINNIGLSMEAGASFNINGGSVGIGIGSGTPTSALQVNGTVTATSFSGSGANLTGLNASQITTGTLPDAQLSANVAKLSGSQTFTGPLKFGASDNQLWLDNFGIRAINNNQSKHLLLQLSGGNVGIGTASPATRLHIKQLQDSGGTSANNDGIRLEAASGEYWGIQTQGGGDLVFDSGLGVGYSYIQRNSGGYVVVSDARLKKNVQPLGSTLDRVRQLRPVTFQYKKAPDDSRPVVGFIAQEVQPLFPELVDEKEGMLAVSYAGFGPIAIGAIKELAERLEKVEKRETHLAELEQKAARVDVLERDVADLKKLVAQLAEAGKAAKHTALAAPPKAPGAAVASLQGASSSVGLDR